MSRMQMSHVTHTCMRYGLRTMPVQRASALALWMSHVAHINGSFARTNDFCPAFICMNESWCRCVIWRCSELSSCSMSDFATHTNKSYHTYEYFITQVCNMAAQRAPLWMSHVTFMNASRHAGSGCSCEWVMGTHMNASWHTYKWVMSYMWVSHVTQEAAVRANKSCHTYGYVTPHTWMSHITQEAAVRSVAPLLCEWVFAHIWVSPVTHTNDSSLTWRSHVTHTMHPCVTHEWVMSRTKWLFVWWVIAHIWMSHGTHMIDSWHTSEWVRAHIYECVMGHIWMSQVTQEAAAHANSPGTHMNESCHTHEWSHVTHMNESCHAGSGSLCGAW